MDLDSDGHVDILSGSYSRMEQSMAGLFQVLWGTEGRAFRAAEALTGTDGEPLIIPADDANMVDKICTRPTAVDLDADGKLDIVSGNFRGTFYLFAGEGEGRFAPEATLIHADGSPLEVPAHSDPFFVDWDRDGDLDLLSGSARGGVFLSINEGTREAAAFAEPIELVEPAGYGEAEMTPDDSHLTGPAAGTRVWADDLNGDGKLDLLVGDNAYLLTPAEGVELESARAQHGDWEKRQQELFESSADMDPEDFQKKYQELQEDLATFANEQRTGFVWVLYQK